MPKQREQFFAADREKRIALVSLEAEEEETAGAALSRAERRSRLRNSVPSDIPRRRFGADKNEICAPHISGTGEEEAALHGRSARRGICASAPSKLPQSPSFPSSGVTAPGCDLEAFYRHIATATAIMA
jgi:hypothetical protein